MLKEGFIYKARVTSFGNVQKRDGTRDPRVELLNGEGGGYIEHSKDPQAGAISNGIRGALKPGDMVSVRYLGRGHCGHEAGMFIANAHGTDPGLAREMALEDPRRCFVSESAFLGRLEHPGKNPNEWTAFVYDKDWTLHFGVLQENRGHNTINNLEGRVYQKRVHPMLEEGDRVLLRKIGGPGRFWFFNVLFYATESDGAYHQGKPVVTGMRDGYVWDLPVHLMYDPDGDPYLGGLFPTDFRTTDYPHRYVRLSGDYEPGLIAPPLRITEDRNAQITAAIE